MERIRWLLKKAYKEVFNPRSRRQEQEDLSELEANLVYRVSFRTASAKQILS